MASCSSNYRCVCPLWSQKVTLRCKTDERLCSLSVSLMHGTSIAAGHSLSSRDRIGRMEPTPSSLSSLNLHSEEKGSEQHRHQEKTLPIGGEGFWPVCCRYMKEWPEKIEQRKEKMELGNSDDQTV